MCRKSRVKRLGLMVVGSSDCRFVQGFSGCCWGALACHTWAEELLGMSPVGACWKPSMLAPCKSPLAQRDRPCNQTHVTQFRAGIEGVVFAGSSEFRFSIRFWVWLQPLQEQPTFFGVCWVPQGSGLNARRFSQEAESRVTFENCTGASVASGSSLGNDVWES